MKANTKTDTIMSRHMKQLGHTADWENTDILHLEHSLSKRKILEMIYIHKNIERVMNERCEVGLVCQFT